MYSSPPPSRSSLLPAVLLSLAATAAGALVFGGLAAILATGIRSDITTVLLIALCSAAGALGSFAYALLATVRKQLQASEQRLREERAQQTADSQAASAPQRPADAIQASAEAPAASPAQSMPTQEEAIAKRPTPPPWQPPPPAPPTWLERKAGELFAIALNWFKTGNTIARVGIIILFIGAALLAKYAAEHGMVPVELRLAAIAAAAIILLGWGWRLRQRNNGYALTLQGGGIAILYLTIYSSLRLYGLMPAGMAFSLMVLVAVAAAILAVAQNALPLAVIGFAGGFAAPLLTASGEGSHIALFSYYAVLNLGVFVVAWFRAWQPLNLLGFVFTFAVSALWQVQGYNDSQLLSSAAFLLLFFFLYAAVSVLFAWRQPPDLKGYVSGTLVFGLPVISFTLLASLIQHIDYALACSALGFGLFYLLLATVLHRQQQAHWRLLLEAFAALGVIFASLAVPLAFGGQVTAAVWAVEGAGLMWLGIRQQRKLTRAFAALLQLGAALYLLPGLLFSTPAGSSASIAIFNGGFLATVGLAVTAAFSAFWLYRARQSLARYERFAPWGFLLWALFWWLLAGFMEVVGYAPTAVYAGLLLLVPALTAWLLEQLGRRLDWQPSAQLAPLFAAVMLIWGTLKVLDGLQPLAHGAYFGWPLLWLGYYGLLYRRDQHSAAALPSLTPWLHALGVWALALVIIFESRWQLSQQLGGVWPALVWGLLPALLVVICSRTATVWPLQAHSSSYRLNTALPLVLSALLWLLLVNMGNDGNPTPLPYLPLFNPLDITVLLTLAALLLWWQALHTTEQARFLPFAYWLSAALVFIWLNAALIRALHYLFATPLDSAGILSSVVVQMALSIFWALLGFTIMVSATRRHWRHLWMVGAGLMTVLVVKLFLLDLAGTETLARTISFLSVGALLLVVGYFSPLPPRPEKES